MPDESGWAAEGAAVALLGLGALYVLAQKAPSDVTVQTPSSVQDAVTSATTLSTGPQHTDNSGSGGSTSDGGGGSTAVTTGNMSAVGETTDIQTRSKRRQLFSGAGGL